MAFLGIDMGGTASRWVLAGTDGGEIARGTAPGATGLVGDPGRRATFIAALAAIRAAIPAPAERVHLGMTGVGFSRDPAITALCAQALGIATERISHENDVELAWRAAFGAASAGHLVLAGTGSVGMTRAADGASVIIGGHGALIDDGGAGAWIALRALKAVLRRIDEAGRPEGLETLAQALFDAIGGSGWDHVRAYVYDGDRGRTGLLARAVAQAAQAGDGTARAILNDAAQELERLAHILIERGIPAPMVFSGGVLALDPVIFETLAERLHPHAPQLRRLDAAEAAARHARESA